MAATSAGWHVTLLFTLTHGLALAFALRELLLLRGAGKRRNEGDARPPADLPPLPDCLRPRPRPARRVPELV